ncbi:glycine betaine/L-proline ABC transporter ATP-binding protein [Actinomyces johnsonii]|uniref:Glycine betaine/L-proline ABC transporter ATP-binding protein n=1 Tax=Actinomyces johnsonii TaxID=544581 RepID=A0A508A5S6_9ACTO|nr:glycine betaine/L-proline ABC transporter ATP-binding protein [Actinomyces johnsonii]KAA8742205.1 glycine betaine/L-proline ABC transporter ATP-binding protein [Actinomyces johnsonii]TQD44747.1 glycine betaine/L-proline ABC transporter ATP-binding protein [Actinomyces johnsonii]
MKVIEANHVYKVFGRRSSDGVKKLKAGKTRDDLRKSGQTAAVIDTSFDVDKGEIFVVMGLSGSGKSTLIRMVNGLLPITAGSMTLYGEDLAHISKSKLRELRRRRVSMVFQNFALLPHRTVGENAAYGLEIQGVGRSERERRAEKALSLVGLEGWGGYKPGELSGGMRQRVGLARALAAETDILLMDEAFSALDPLIRREMQDQLIDLQGKLGKTILFITHDLNEAMRLGDRIAMMRDGRIEQVGTAEEILRDPASDYVSRFVADVDRTRVLTAGSIAEPPYAILGSDRSPRAAHKLLRENQPSWLLVQNRDRTPFGYVWEDDVARAVKEGSDILPLSTVHEMPVVSHTTPVNELFSYAAQHAAPIVVVDDDGRISGVIPRVTLLAAISDQNQGVSAGSAEDAESSEPAQADDAARNAVAEQTDEQAGEASETTEAEGADA